MKIVAHRGNRLHAPENTRTALLSAYTAGADVLELDIQLTRDGYLVISHDGTTDRLTGQQGKIPEMSLEDLKALDFSKTYKPRGTTDFHYRHNKRHPVQIETFPELLDILPRDVPLLVELKHDSSLGMGHRDEFVGKAIAALTDRELLDRVVVYSKDQENLKLAKKLAPGLCTATFDWEVGWKDQIDLMLELGADGLVTELANVLDPQGKLTDMGRELERLYVEQRLALGAILYPFREQAVFTEAEYGTLLDKRFVWSISTDSMLDVAGFVQPSFTLVKESFAGTEINTDLWALGYAKANKYCHVFQDDGVHVTIAPYDGPITPPPTNPVEQRLQVLEEQIMYALMDWPYYSGGGVGFAPGIDGDFVAEVDYEVAQVGQATTLEMAVLNVDPGAHQPPWNEDGTPRLPRTFRDKDSFYDPHGAPPWVGAEHDENDGYRINWNLGAEFDSNQYGKPVGDGSALSGRLRLERRGPYFAAYYRNQVDAPDWVCVGTVRNDSLNSKVYLRCAGKRWRQERADDPSQYWPILPNEFIFRNLIITRFRRRTHS